MKIIAFLLFITLAVASFLDNTNLILFAGFTYLGSLIMATDK